MSASLLVKATKLQECVAAVRVVTATQQDAARLNERLSTLQSRLADLRRAQVVYLACRAADGEGALSEPHTASLAAALSTFRAAHQEQGDLDQAALSLSAAMNALRDDLRNRVAAWWPLHASARVRDAGADAIDLLEPDDQAAARALVDRLRESVDAPPRIPLDITKFQNDLASLTELVAENQVADLPEQLRAVLREVGARRMRLQDLTCETLELLKDRGYADRLSINWGAS